MQSSGIYHFLQFRFLEPDSVNNNYYSSHTLHARALQEQKGYLNLLKISQLQVSNEIVQSRNKTGRTKKFCSIPVVRSVHHS